MTSFLFGGSSTVADEPILETLGILHKNSIKSLCNLYIDFFPKVCYNKYIKRKKEVKQNETVKH